jgi:hypothetical protein
MNLNRLPGQQQDFQNFLGFMLLSDCCIVSGSIGFCGLVVFGSSPIHGGSNQQVMQPVVVILWLHSGLERRRPTRIVEFGSAAIGMKIPDQSHRTQLQAS